MKTLLCTIASGLVAGSLLASTVAYWPMNLSDGKVADSTSAHYDLTVRTAGHGGASFEANDIGWSGNLPPNPDAVGAANLANWGVSVDGTSDSAYYVTVKNGNTLVARRNYGMVIFLK